MGHCLLNLVHSITMNTFVVFAGLLALAAGVPIPEDVEAVPALVPAPVPTFNLAPTLVRAPSHDSASIESHRLGGNFAYAVAEAHAFAKVTPQVSTITHPVAETTVVHEPTPIAHVTPGKVITTKHIPQPIIEQRPILAQEPVIATKTVAHPTFKKVHTVTHTVAQPAVAVHAAPAVAVHAAPAPVAVKALPAPVVKTVEALPALKTIAHPAPYAAHVAPAHVAAPWGYHY